MYIAQRKHFLKMEGNHFLMDYVVSAKDAELNPTNIGNFRVLQWFEIVPDQG